MYSGKTIMRLVDDGTLLRVQNNLLQSKNIQNLHGSWWFNISMLIVIAAIMIFFLMTQYSSTKEVIQAKESRKDIPRQELTWNNSVRNHIEL
jgi:K+ transporter